MAVDFVNVPSYVLARDIPLSTSQGEVSVTVAYGGAIYASLDAISAGLTVDAAHYQDLGSAAGQVHQRNVTVFADGEVDRSPCGSGTCARLAVLADESRVAPAGPTLAPGFVLRCAPRCSPAPGLIIGAGM